MSKIYIVSPTSVATGGTELLQQLCFCINSIGRNSYIFYSGDYNGSPVKQRFEDIYNNPHVNEIEDEADNILVLPETRVGFLRNYKKIQKYIWWLSVDNYYGSMRRKNDLAHTFVYRIKDTINNLYFNKCNHLVQSEYARLYLVNEKGIDDKKIERLSDYLNKTYLLYACQEEVEERNNTILYNPQKGIEFTKKLMEFIPNVTWIALQGYTHDEMIALMRSSKVYIDFGNHPGKDRIPREAAICGCCVITGKRGAAGNSIDVPIDEEFKFKDSFESIQMIKNKIISCMKNYDAEINKFDSYREIILSEEKMFVEDVNKIFGRSNSYE